MNRNLLGAAILALLAVGGGTLLALRADWASATVSVAGLPEVDLAVTGAQAVPGAVGLAILVMAAAAGVIAAGPRLRRIIGGIVLAAGLVGILLVARASESLTEQKARAIDEAAVSGVDVAWGSSAAQGFSIVGFVLTVLVGAAVAWLGPRWATMGRKYDAPVAREPDSSDLWKAMDDGVDPTA